MNSVHLLSNTERTLACSREFQWSDGRERGREGGKEGAERRKRREGRAVGRREMDGTNHSRYAMLPPPQARCVCCTCTHSQCIMVLLYQVCDHTVLAGVGGELCEYPQTAPLHWQLQLSVYVGGDSRGGDVGGPSGEERERVMRGRLTL